MTRAEVSRGQRASGWLHAPALGLGCVQVQLLTAQVLSSRPQRRDSLAWNHTLYKARAPGRPGPSRAPGSDLIGRGGTVAGVDRGPGARAPSLAALMAHRVQGPLTNLRGSGRGGGPGLRRTM